MNYYNKYLKYKNKYVVLKNHIGGSSSSAGNSIDSIWFNGTEQITISEERNILEQGYLSEKDIIFKGITYKRNEIDFNSYESSLDKLYRKQIISIDENEQMLFDLFKECINIYKVNLYIAGGWVRDKIIGIPNDDIDISVDGKTGSEFAHILYNYIRDTEKYKNTNWYCNNPSIIEANSEKSKHLETAKLNITIPNGYKFELDFVGLRKEVYESGSRIPTITTATIIEDAKRRDLTMNSLVYNIQTSKIEDYTGGIIDIHKKIIRTPIDPLLTFTQDALRILRAIRFKCKFNFNIESKTKEAMSNEEIHKILKTTISRERFSKEILGFFKKNSNPILGFIEIFEVGLWNIIFDTSDTSVWGRKSIEYLTQLPIEYIMSPPSKIELVFTMLTFPLAIKKIEYKSKKESITIIDNILIGGLRLDGELKKRVTKMHECIFNFIELENKESWKRSDIGYPIYNLYFAQKYNTRYPNILNDIIIIGKILNSPLFTKIEDFIKTYNLQNIYETVPLLKGNEIIELLVTNNIDPKDDMSKIQSLSHILLLWQFNNPGKTKEEAILYLRENL